MSAAKPLKGRRIVLTRPLEESARLGDRLTALGAEVLAIPLIEVRPSLDRERAMEVFREFSSYEWILFTSRNGVTHFMETFLKAFQDIRSLGFVRIGVIGKGTQEALARYFLKADLVAEVSTAAGLAEALQADQSLDNVKVLVITGNRNAPELVDQLWQARAIVDTLEVYATEVRDLAADPVAARFRKEGADALVFASASAVEGFGEQARHLSLGTGATIPALCSFGPSTTARMKAAGIPVAVQSDEPGLDGMVTALVGHFTKTRP